MKISVQFLSDLFESCFLFGFIYSEKNMHLLSKSSQVTFLHYCCYRYKAALCWRST